MANNYSTCTVQPSIPLALMNPLEKMLLDCIFEHEPDSFRSDDMASAGVGESVYYFAGEAPQSFGCLNRFELLNAATIAKEDKFSRKLAERVLEKIKDCTDDEVELDFDEISARSVDIFQGIVRRAGDKLKYVHIEGAWTCDKMRPGEFGGWAAIITAKGCSEMSTADWVNQQLKRRGLEPGKHGSGA